MNILPVAQRRDEIRFKFFKAMPYNKRLLSIVGLFIIGFFIQSLCVEKSPEFWWLGLPFLFWGTLLSLVHGYDNYPDPGKSAGSSWKPAGKKDLDEIRRISEAAQNWDSSLIDITCVQGFLVFLLLGGLVALASFYMKEYPPWHLVLIGDALVLFFPHWVTGIRRILVDNELDIKTKLLSDIEKFFDQIKGKGEIFKPFLFLKNYKDGRSLPKDVKAMVQFEGGHEKFLGLQIQITVNDVQGTSYPYLYCVLVAHKGFHIEKKIKPLLSKDGYKTPEKVVVELQDEKKEDVEVVVIRQTTTRNSGYYTKPKDCRKILSYSLKLAREIIK